MNVNSIITATISINVNLQQIIQRKGPKVQYVWKDKKRPFTLTIGRDLIFVHFEAWFFTKLPPLCFPEPWFDFPTI